MYQKSMLVYTSPVTSRKAHFLQTEGISEKYFQTKYLNIKNHTKYAEVMCPQEKTFYEDLGNTKKTY